MAKRRGSTDATKPEKVCGSLSYAGKAVSIDPMAAGLASEARQRVRVDGALLRSSTSSLPRSVQGVADLVREMRDCDRF